jgi:hypothetical protein
MYTIEDFLNQSKQEAHFADILNGGYSVKALLWYALLSQKDINNSLKDIDPKLAHLVTLGENYLNDQGSLQELLEAKRKAYGYDYCATWFIPSDEGLLAARKAALSMVRLESIDAQIKRLDRLKRQFG